MTFREFLDASYALLIEGYTSVAPNRIDLLSAIQRVEDSWERPEPKAPIARQNEQSMAQLNALMAGVKR